MFRLAFSIAPNRRHHRSVLSRQPLKLHVISFILCGHGSTCAVLALLGRQIRTLLLRDLVRSLN